MFNFGAYREGAKGFCEFRVVGARRDKSLKRTGAWRITDGWTESRLLSMKKGSTFQAEVVGRFRLRFDRQFGLRTTTLCNGEIERAEQGSLASQP